MLRITMVSQTREKVMLKVEGWVSGENVDLLEQEGAHWLRQADRVVLDFAGVKSIDSKGITLLRHWLGKQVVVRGESPYIHMLLYNS